jgi:hypothetical protein
MTKNEIHIAIDEAGNPNDEKPFIISAVLINDTNCYLSLYEEAIKDAQRLTGKNIKYFKWSEDSPKQFKLGKDVKGIFVNKVLKNLTGISLIMRKVNETKLSNFSAKIYGEILGLHLRKYVAGKSVVVHYDRTPIVREHVMKDELKEECRQKVEEYFKVVIKNFKIKEINIKDYE